MSPIGLADQRSTTESAAVTAHEDHYGPSFPCHAAAAHPDCSRTDSISAQTASCMSGGSRAPASTCSGPWHRLDAARSSPLHTANVAVQSVSPHHGCIASPQHHVYGSLVPVRHATSTFGASSGLAGTLDPCSFTSLSHLANMQARDKQTRAHYVLNGFTAHQPVRPPTAAPALYQTYGVHAHQMLSPRGRTSHRPCFVQPPCSSNPGHCPRGVAPQLPDWRAVGAHQRQLSGHSEQAFDSSALPSVRCIPFATADSLQASQCGQPAIGQLRAMDQTILSPRGQGMGPHQRAMLPQRGQQKFASPPFQKSAPQNCAAQSVAAGQLLPRCTAGSHAVVTGFPMVAAARHAQERADSGVQQKGLVVSGMSLAQIFAVYGTVLTNYEHAEIFDFNPHIFYLGVPSAKKAAEPHMPNFGFDDEDGHMKLTSGAHIAYRYQIDHILGSGTFAQVAKCYDHKRSRWVAVKVIRNQERFHRQAVYETGILTALSLEDREDKFHCLRMYSHFKFRNHVCIVTELLSYNLYQVIEMHEFKALSEHFIKRVARQMLEALSFLGRMGVIHCDLKPENVMLRGNGTYLKVCDFGSSCTSNSVKNFYIQSRLYRAPEIMAGMAYTASIDMWSFGAMLAELYLGKPLFPGKNEQSMLVLFSAAIGAPPVDYFKAGLRPRTFLGCKAKKDAFLLRLNELAGTNALQDQLQGASSGLIDLVSRCLRWVPAERLCPAEALQHRWLQPLGERLMQ